MVDFIVLICIAADCIFNCLFDNFAYIVHDKLILWKTKWKRRWQTAHWFIIVWCCWVSKPLGIINNNAVTTVRRTAQPPSTIKMKMHKLFLPLCLIQQCIPYIQWKRMFTSSFVSLLSSIIVAIFYWIYFSCSIWCAPANQQTHWFSPV